MEPPSEPAGGGDETTGQHRFLLQDNLMPAWHGNRRKSVSERIQDSVLQLMEIVDKETSGCK